MRSFCATGATTEPSTVRAFLGDHEQEIIATQFARSVLCSFPSSIRYNEDFLIANHLAHAAGAVTAVTTSDEIGDVVIGRVVIEMVDRKGPVTSAFPWQPLDSATTPMTGVSPPPQLGKQDQALHGHLSVCRREWMIGSINTAIAVHRRTVYSHE